MIETTIIEHAILKIGKLLALGFGEAGSKIIADNIQDIGDFNCFQKGSKILGIFGFCNILHFAEITDILNVETMTLVNQISEIVHTNVD